MIWRFLNLILNLAVRSFYELKIEGEENIPASGAVIIVGNQDNASVALAAEAALRRKIYWAVSPAICRSRLLRFFLKILWGWFSLNPERPDITGFQAAFGVLKSSGILAFYPGGIHQGVALFCLRAGCNILPMAITQEALNRRRIKITFGPVFNLSEYQNITVNVRIIEQTIQRINQSIEQLRN